MTSYMCCMKLPLFLTALPFNIVAMTTTKLPHVLMWSSCSCIKCSPPTALGHTNDEGIPVLLVLDSITLICPS